MAIGFPSLALVKRELLRSLRKSTSFACVVVLMAVVMVVVLAMWPEDAQFFAQAGRASRQILTAFSVILLFGACLLVPAIASGAIVLEREQRTFDLLNLTLIRPAGIVAAKLVNAVGMFIICAIATMPVLGALFFLIGLDWDQVFMTFGIILAAAFSCAMIAIYCSTRFRKSLTATIVSYVAGAFLMGGHILLCAVFWDVFELYRAFRSLNRLTESLVYIFSPLGTIIGLESRTSATEFCLALVYHAAIVAVCFVLALRILARPPDREVKAPADDTARADDRARRFRYHRSVRRRTSPFRDGLNPMFTKELGWGLAPRRRLLKWASVAAFAVFLCIGLMVIDELGILRHGRLTDEAIAITLVLHGAIITFLGLTLLANSIPKEYERNNMDLLRLTLLSPRDIVLGKVLTGALCLAPVLLAALLSTVPHAFAAVAFGGVGCLFTGYVTLIVCAALALGISFVASLLTKRTTLALVVSYLMGLFVFGGMSAIAAISRELIGEISHRRHYYGEPYDAMIAFLSPLVAYVYNAGEYAKGGPVVNLYWASNVAVFALLALALIVGSVLFFARFRARDR